MENLMDLIKKRRSVRSYRRDEIPEELIRDVVEAAIWAPSAGNTQALKFIFTKPGQTLKLLGFCPGISGNPPHLIIVCSDMKKAILRGSDRELVILDSGFAVQNLLLAAEDRGLSTCVVKSSHQDALRKLLQLPEYIQIEMVVSIGYSDKIPKAPKRLELSEVLYIDKWKEDSSNE